MLPDNRNCDGRTCARPCGACYVVKLFCMRRNLLLT